MKPGDARRAWSARRSWLGLLILTLAVMLYGLVAEKILKQELSPVVEIGLFYAVFVSALVVVFVKNTVFAAATLVLAMAGLAFFSGLIYFGLIAFAYTYHYINWFSKTSIIKWHAISTSRAAVIAAVWLGSVALYATATRSD